MPDLVYLDNSALVRIPMAMAGSQNPVDIQGQKGLEALIESDAYLSTSPVGLAEYWSVLYTQYRDSAVTWFDQSAVDAGEEKLMGWLASGRIRVRNLGPRAFEMGMAYVATASREHTKKMKAWDAIHLYEACNWSRENGGKQVTLATGDGDFAGFLKVFPEFERHVRILDTTAA